MQNSRSTVIEPSSLIRFEHRCSLDMPSWLIIISSGVSITSLCHTHVLWPQREIVGGASSVGSSRRCRSISRDRIDGYLRHIRLSHLNPELNHVIRSILDEPHENGYWAAKSAWDHLLSEGARQLEDNCAIDAKALAFRTFSSSYFASGVKVARDERRPTRGGTLCCGSFRSLSRLDLSRCLSAG